MRWTCALALASVSPAGAFGMPLHQFSNLALSPNGNLVAAVENDQEPNAPATPQDHVVVRNARTGTVVRTLPACPGCSYPGLSFAPDGQ
jgi:hypothetical protein